MTDIRVLVLILVMALVTVMLRALPFIVLKGKKTPESIEYLGKYLPYSIIAMLIVYCLKDISFVKRPFGMPEIIASVIVAGLHAWKKNTLLSIVAGTVIFMILKQFVFC